MIKHIYIFLLFITLSVTTSRGDDSFPYSYFLKEYNPEGQILITSENGLTHTYHFKYNLANNTQLIYKWQGLERNNAVGESFGNILVLAAAAIDEGLLLCIEKEGVIYLELLDEELKLIDSIGLELNIFQRDQLEVSWKGEVSANKYLIRVGEFLYLLDINNNQMDYTFISNSVVDAGSFYEISKNDSSFAYLVDKEGNLILFYGDDSGQSKAAARIQYSGKTKLMLIPETAVALSEFQSQTLVQIHQKNSGMSSLFWINASIDNIAIISRKTKPKIVFLEEHTGSYELKTQDIFSEKENITANKLLPHDLIEPIGIFNYSQRIYILYRNGIISIDRDNEILGKDIVNIGGKLDGVQNIEKLENTLIITANNGIVYLGIKENHFWLLNRFMQKTGDILLPAILILLLLLFIQLYRHQKRLLKTVLELPQTGFVFVLDKNGNLIRANDPGREILSINQGVTLRKRFSYYCNQSDNSELKRLFEKAIHEKLTFTEKITLTNNDETKEILCNATILKNITGNFRGMVLTGVDITEQLERKRLTNWAQLAHDMQTNLSTIRLNAEQIEINGNPVNNKRRSKIVQQVNLLMQRVRDIVTVGREDELDITPVLTDELCLLVRDEIDELMFPDIEIKMNITSFQFYCDKQKMIRAIRNAVENAIKAIKVKPGRVDISCFKDSSYAYFSIKDNGAGMNEETRKKMLNPYFTTRKGTGGSGIGTMIMKKVTELHKGNINIKSEQGVGTEVIFILPLNIKNFNATIYK